MKRLYLLCTLAIFSLLLHTKTSQAQITGVIVYVNDTAATPCSLPSTSSIYVHGIVMGSAATNDSVTIYLNYGNGSDSTFKLPIMQTYFGTSFQRTNNLTGTFITMATVTTSNNLTDTAYSNPVTYTNLCEDLSGRVFLDGNSNCTFDPGEGPLKWRTVKITNTVTNAVLWKMTDSVGMYYASLPLGTYTIEPIITTANITPACPTTGITTLTVSAGPYVENFAYNCNTTAAVDVSANAWSAGFRPGFNRPLTVHASSTNICAIQSAVLSVVLDPRLSYTSTLSGPAPTSVVGTTLGWTFTSLNALQSFLSTMNIYCIPTANIGDTACITITVTTTANDTNLSNNTYTLCVPIRNSFDPNDKHVSPMGRESAGYILNGTELTYLINFQNTGNDVAYDVVVTDVIDADLDISSLRVLNASHAMKPTLIADNEIAFRFENINLPDSNTNEPASHGHIVYAIKPKSILSHGTPIHNTAHIFFDYNSAIITNTTLNTIEIPTGIQHISKGTLKASVYPNPTHQQIYIETDGTDKFTVAMFDVLGRSVDVQEGTNGKATIDVSKVTNGMYLLKISTNEKELSTRINVQH